MKVRANKCTSAHKMATEVQKYTFLYDNSDKNYKNRTCADKALAKIASKLCIEGELPVSRLFRNRTVKSTTRRWGKIH